MAYTNTAFETKPTSNGLWLYVSGYGYTIVPYKEITCTDATVCFVIDSSEYVAWYFSSDQVWKNSWGTTNTGGDITYRYKLTASAYSWAGWLFSSEGAVVGWYDNNDNWDSSTAVRYSFKFVKITGAGTTDTDNDGTPDDTDVDPYDPDEDGTDSDNDGVEDDLDCDPNDSTNTNKKPNCYHCDDDSYATDASSCDSTHDYDLDGEAPDWNQLKADIKTDMLRLGINFDVLGNVGTTNKSLLIKYPNGGTSIANVTYGEIDLSTNPDSWESGTLKTLMVEGKDMIKKILMFLLSILWITRVAKLIFGV